MYNLIECSKIIEKQNGVYGIFTEMNQIVVWMVHITTYAIIQQMQFLK